MNNIQWEILVDNLCHTLESISIRKVNGRMEVKEVMYTEMKPWGKMTF